MHIMKKEEFLVPFEIGLFEAARSSSILEKNEEFEAEKWILFFVCFYWNWQDIINIFLRPSPLVDLIVDCFRSFLIFLRYQDAISFQFRSDLQYE